MTTIMLTAIGIILAAAGALMTIYYGGARFNSDTAKANAQTLMNAGANVRAASGVYYASKGALPTTPEKLIAESAVQSMPMVEGIGQPGATWRDFAAAGEPTKKAYVVSGVKDDVCRYVNQGLISASREQILTKPEGITGCYAESGTNVYYAMLGDAAPENAALTSCDNPPEDQSDIAIDAQICSLKQSLGQIALVATSTGATDDFDLTAANPRMATGAVAGILYKPGGGKFGRGPYVTFYLKYGYWEHSRFCQRWALTQKPLGVENCNDWYFSHIVIHL